MVDIPEEVHDQIMHYGIKRKSGRYPWGSGGDPYQNSVSFRKFHDEMLAQGMKPTEIAKFISEYSGKPFSTVDLRANIAISKETITEANASRAQYLTQDRGMSQLAAAKQMGVNESTLRGWLKNSDRIQENSLRATTDVLKNEVNNKQFLDVGKGNHLHIGIPFTKFNTALAALQDEGYEVHPIQVPQSGRNKNTRVKVLCPPGTPWNEARKAVMEGRLRIIAAQSDDGGQTFSTPKDLPVSVSSKRIQVRHAEDGGATMDGVIELRRGATDLDLGTDRYAQVRIAVDGTHFLKGMAMYATDLPDGVDIRFNTNKTKTEAPGKLDAMKAMKVNKETGTVDPTNPFGSTTHSRMYTTKSGKTKQSALNIVGSEGSGNVEGRWDGWARTLSSQMLSKQPLTLASAQLGKARAAKEKDLEDIMSLTNPVVKRKLLEEYADSADAAAVHLKAAKMDRQSTHVLLPMNSMRPHEIYAPNFDNGEKVVLVRHPHGGPFEIPELTVNNLNRTAKAILGGAKDAVGIHWTVAQQLSGADFDGDTVLVIPNPKGAVKSRPPLEGLKNFDAKVRYKIPEEDTTITRMTKRNTQTEMGKISNLITDMSIKGANDDELAAAIRHSMVVIDAEKHGLNYKQSAIDNNIASLKEKYQGGKRAGGNTIISRASSEASVPQQKPRSWKDGGPIDAKTGRLVFVPTGKPPYINKAGKLVEPTTKGTKMEFTRDARQLMSDPKNPHPMEAIYASHANTMKDLANAARKAMVSLEMPKISTAAKAVYASEVSSLTSKLQEAQRNAPLERRAQSLAKELARTRIDANPGLDKDDIKKITGQSIVDARNITGANKVKVYIEDREWEAIQARAIPHSKVAEIFANADMDRVKTLATPRRRTYLTPGQIARARNLAAMGRPMSQIADELGIPRSTIIDNLNNS